jgi:hypothetical protein
MSESKDTTLLSSEELEELVRHSSADSLAGISAIEARVAHESSLSLLHSAEHLSDIAATLEGTKKDGTVKPFGIVVSVDQCSIENIGTVVVNALQPQITANTTGLATADTNIQTLTGQTVANTTDLAAAKTNIQTLIGQTSVNTTDLATAKTNIKHLEEAVEKRWKEIHAELVRLIEAEWREECRRLGADLAGVTDRVAVLEVTVPQHADHGTHPAAAPPAVTSRSPRGGGQR